MSESNPQDGRDGRPDEREDAAGNGAARANGTDAAGQRTGTGEDPVAALTAERDEMKDRMLRIAAEFENWKKRARKEQEDGEAKVRESVLRDMLDVLDNLERAVGAYGKPATEHGGKDDKNKAAPAGADAGAVVKGVELVLRLLQSKLERYGVKPIETKGQPFDPRMHEAISRIETSDVPAGHVAAELQRGYRIGERLLRPAMVGVATASANAAPAGSAAGDDGA